MDCRCRSNADRRRRRKLHGHPRSGGAPSHGIFEKVENNNRRRGWDDYVASAEDAPRAPPTLYRCSPMTHTAGRSSSIHSPTNRTTHNSRYTLDKARRRHRHLHSDGTEGREDSCTQAGEVGLHLHTLVAGTGENRRRGREKQGSTLFQADVAAATALMTSSEP